MARDSQFLTVEVPLDVPLSPAKSETSLESANVLLSEQVRRFEAALRNMSQGLCMFDEHSRLVVCNQRYHELFDLPLGRISFGMSQEDLCQILIDNGCYPSTVTLNDLRQGTRLALQANNGRPVIRELASGRILSVRYRSMEGGGWVSTFDDITDQRISEARIAHLAHYDGLTDLVNSRTLRDGTHDVLVAFDPCRPILALLYLDLDRFKFVNDTYGHSVGDELLRAVATRLRDNTYTTAVIGRLGGDEFAVMKRVSDEATAIAIANSLVLSIAEPYHLSVGRVDVGVSIGIAAQSGVVPDVEPLLQDADLALRSAKANGRGTVCFFDPQMSEAARLRRTLEAELHVALADEQFELHYQPLVELDGDSMVGVEALVRWRHPENGLVPPGIFIPVAEEIGLIVQLGEWVLRQACRDAATWPSHIVVAVNVSSMQMRQKGFADMVFQALTDAALEPRRLEIEITESALLDESETTMHNLNVLRERGVRFAMDDFGTGYSSLSYLRRFPIDKIKIDRSFMKDAESSADALAIIRAVAGLGVSLGITTLVEGVETESQLDLARSEGLGQVQGYLFSRPQPEPVITRMLHAEDNGGEKLRQKS